MSVMEATPPETRLHTRDDEPLFEVIDGEIVELPPMSFHSSKIASRLLRMIGLHTDAKGLGEIVGETLFHMPLKDDQSRNRRPDVAFVSYERWPRDKPESFRENAWDVVPDLAIEVVSPSDTAQDLMDKVGEFFKSGVRQVWIVYPRQKLIQIHDSVLSVRGVGEESVLDGGKILPGLQLPLKELFVYDRIPEPENGDD